MLEECHEFVGSFSPVAAAVDVEGERRLLVLANFGQPILDPVWFSTKGEGE